MSCPGKCLRHPLADELVIRMESGVRWGDILYVPEKAIDEEYIREYEKIRDSSKMRTYAHMQGKLTHKNKIMRPCKWVYLNVEDNTYSTHLSGAQCWAWEYDDPRTGKRECPHTCKHLHPNEFGWRDEWN